MEMKSFVARLDGWLNLITGLGVRGKDKRLAAFAEWHRNEEDFFDHLFAADDTAKKIVCDLVEDALREEFEFAGVSEEQKKRLSELTTEHGLREKLQDAWETARHKGGAAILYLTKGTSDMDQPMQPNEEVIALTVLNRFELRAETISIDTNPASKTFRMPTQYRLQIIEAGQSELNNLVIHASRLERFDGTKLPRRLFVQNEYWHDSVLTRLYNPIRNYNSSHDSAAAIMQDFNVGVFKMRNLAELVAAGKEKQIQERIELANYSKSVIRSLIIDESETYEEKSRNVTGLPELLRATSNRLVAGSNMPHTRLLGESPDGSNATGNSTTTAWYDYVAAQQRNYLKPKIINILRKLIPDLPKMLDIEFKSLWQLDESEEADARLKVAQADAIYLDRNVIDPSEVAVSRFGGKKYSRETKIDTATREVATPEQTPTENNLPPNNTDTAPKVSEKTKSAALNGGPSV